MRYERRIRDSTSVASRLDSSTVLAETGASAMGGHRVGDELLELLPEHLAIELARVAPQGIAVPVRRFHAPDRVDQRIDALLGKQHPRASVDDRVERSAGGVSNHRAAAGIGFERRDA